jgi:hypothetical protein
VICEAFKWTHLPVAGGLYDQHPELIDGFYHILAKRAEKEEKKRKAEERKNKSSGSRRGASRSR